GASHHHTILFLALPLFAFLLVRHFKFVLSPFKFLGGIFFFLLGLTPYVYLWWAPAKSHIASWGHIESWANFTKHFFRQEYGTFQLAAGEHESNFFVSLYKFAQAMWFQNWGLMALPFLAALFVLALRSKKAEGKPFAAALALSFFFYVIVFHALANLDIENRLYLDVQTRFWLLPYLLFCFLAVWGLHQLSAGSPRRVHRGLMVFLVGILAFRVWQDLPAEKQASTDLYERLGHAFVDTLPSDATILVRGDVYINSVRYVQFVEGYRTDIDFIPIDLMWWPWMKGKVAGMGYDFKMPGETYQLVSTKDDRTFDLVELVKANPQKKIFVTKLNEPEEKLVEGSFEIQNFGFLGWIHNPALFIPPEIYQKWAKGFDNFKPPLLNDIRESSWEAFVYFNYWDREYFRTHQLISQAKERGFPSKELKYLEPRFRNVFAGDTDPPASVWKNAGMTYQFLADAGDLKLVPEMTKVWEGYLERVSEDQDDEVPKIRQLLKQLKERGLASP
ncbi:MAG: hypothetical protein KDD22_03685, partial [Bdellovibrionales bacterium]|nr:hypothetical protein [Bdellovibrionales bacterium]